MIIDDIKKRLSIENRNWICAICGATGTGKSWSALKLASLVDPDFCVERVVFSGEEFLALLNSGKLHRGSAIVWDECGVGIGSRDWYSASNKQLNYIFQTFRHQNLAIVFTTPTLSFIDSATRKLFHSFVETISINRQKQSVKVKIKNIQTNADTGKVYKKYSVVMNGMQRMKMKRHNIFKPDEKLIKSYESKKKRFTKELNLQAEREIKKEKEKAKRGRRIIDVSEIVKEVIKNLPEYKGKQCLVDKYLIMGNFNIGLLSAKKVVAMVESKTKQNGRKN